MFFLANGICVSAAAGAVAALESGGGAVGLSAAGRAAAGRAGAVENVAPSKSSRMMLLGFTILARFRGWLPRQIVIQTMRQGYEIGRNHDHRGAVVLGSHFRNHLHAPQLQRSG